MTEQFTTVIAVADEPNKNGRIYTKEAMEKVITEFAQKPVLGKLGMERSAPLSLVEVSHQITNLRMVEGKVIGDVKVLRTPYGQILSQLYNTGVSISYGVAGTGNIEVQPDGTKLIKNFTLLSVNAIPSDEAA